MPFAGVAEVLLNQKVGPEHFLMRISAPELTREAKPGQFVLVRCHQGVDPLLRRPFSLHGIDYARGTVSILYQVVGRGTKLLAEMPAGAGIDLLGPLGNGFVVPDRIRQVLVIGGGIGVAPLFPLIQALKHYQIEQTVLLGARSADFIIGSGQLASLGVHVELATEDGSMGAKGLVTDLAEKLINLVQPDYFFACGPNPMLKELLKLTRRFGIDGQVSLEEQMGCGVGACLACVCKTVVGRQSPVVSEKEKAAAGGKRKAIGETKDGEAGFEYKKVCTDGPVFTAGEVIFDG